MSERGSFVTQYIYCDECLEAAKKILLHSHKYLNSTLIPHWSKSEGEYMPIIAGKIGGLYAGEELDDFENKIAPDLSVTICHPMRVAVIAEQGEKIFTINPKQD